MQTERLIDHSDGQFTLHRRRKVAQFIAHLLPGSRAERARSASLKKVAAGIDEFIDYAGHRRLHSSAEVEEAKRILHEAGPQLPGQLGYRPEAFKLSANNPAFLKENDARLRDVTERFFRVVQDNNDEWLLKYAGLMGRRDGHDIVSDTRRLQGAEAEVLAYKIASALGYPVPETRLVTPMPSEIAPPNNSYNAYLAYRFIPKAMDHSYYTVRDNRYKSLTPISNVNDVSFRPILNALIGSFGDSSHQGIVSQGEGIYYAQDLSVSSPLLYKNGTTPFTNWSEALYSYFDAESEASSLDHVRPPAVTSELKETFDNYFRIIRQLTPENVAVILSPDTPFMQGQAPALSQAISERAQVLTTMYDTGFFD